MKENVICLFEINFVLRDNSHHKATIKYKLKLLFYDKKIQQLNFEVLHTWTIFSHCVPLPAPGPPRTNITIGLLALDIIRLAVSDISAMKYDKWNMGKRQT